MTIEAPDVPLRGTNRLQFFSIEGKLSIFYKYNRLAPHRGLQQLKLPAAPLRAFNNGKIK
jgi:hypothetical protein